MNNHKCTFIPCDGQLVTTNTLFFCPVCFVVKSFRQLKKIIRTELYFLNKREKELKEFQEKYDIGA